MADNRRTWLDDIKTALDKLGVPSLSAQIYEQAAIERKKHLNADKFPVSWKEMVCRTIRENCGDNDYWKENKDTFFRTFDENNVEYYGLSKWLPIIAEIKGFAPGKASSNQALTDLQVKKRAFRKQVLVNRIIRDTPMSARIKSLHKDCCQLCGETLVLCNGATYSEAHHLQPLGEPYNGPDSQENLIVLCPNCHVKCDYAAIPINWEKIKNRSNHPIRKKFVDHHNARFEGEKSCEPENYLLVDKAD